MTVQACTSLRMCGSMQVPDFLHLQHLLHEVGELMLASPHLAVLGPAPGISHIDHGPALKYASYRWRP